MDEQKEISTGETLSDEEKMRRLPWFAASQALNNVFGLLTCFGSIFLLFLTELGLPKHIIGFLIALLPFCGLMAPFVSGLLERFGNKRVYLLCFGTRKLVIALLMLLPWIISRYGEKHAVHFLIAVIAVFAVLRAIGEAAFYAWGKECIPDRMRGKYSATVTVSCGIANLLTVFCAGKIIGRTGGIEKYMLLIGSGCIIGIISVYLMSFVPGGELQKKKRQNILPSEDIWEPLKDRNFLYFLAAIGAALFGATLMVFTPLFVKENLGIVPGNVVLLDNATIIGSLIFSFFWGWMADRYGGRPVVILNLSIYSFVAVGWLLLSLGNPAAAVFVAMLYFFSGGTINGRAVGESRVLYSGILPQDGVVYYTSLYYAWIGFIGGLSSLIAGYILNRFSAFSVVWSGWTLNSYTIIFALNILCQLTAIILYRKVKPDKRIKTRHLLFRMFRQTMRWMSLSDT